MSKKDQISEDVRKIMEDAMKKAYEEAGLESEDRANRRARGENKEIESRHLTSSLKKKRKWCISKNKYSTEEEARLVQKRRLKEAGVSLAVYRCKNCNGFHLTSRTT